MQQHNSDNHADKPMLPQSGRIAIYARVAPGAKRTTSPQTDDFLAFAREQGFSNEQIIVYEDRNVSGRTPLFERGAFNDLMTTLAKPQPEDERIHAIYTSSANRLFRDATVAQVSTFVEMCATHGIRLITPSQTYDFTRADHIAAFRFQYECEQATLYLA